MVGMEARLGANGWIRLLLALSIGFVLGHVSGRIFPNRSPAPGPTTSVSPLENARLARIEARLVQLTAHAARPACDSSAANTDTTGVTNEGPVRAAQNAETSQTADAVDPEQTAANEKLTALVDTILASGRLDENDLDHFGVLTLKAEAQQSQTARLRVIQAINAGQLKVNVTRLAL